MFQKDFFHAIWFVVVVVGLVFVYFSVKVFIVARTIAVLIASAYSKALLKKQYKKYIDTGVKTEA